MIEELTAAGKSDLLWIGYVLAGTVFNNDEDLQWLKGRFESLHDFLWESPVYREIITEAESRGIETGKMQALSQARLELNQSFLKLVSENFPELAAMARQCTDKIQDNSALLDLMVKIGTAHTQQDARAILEACLQA